MTLYALMAVRFDGPHLIVCIQLRSYAVDEHVSELQIVRERIGYT